jgi:hypothetical protein
MRSVSMLIPIELLPRFCGETGQDALKGSQGGMSGPEIELNRGYVRRFYLNRHKPMCFVRLVADLENVHKR